MIAEEAESMTGVCMIYATASGPEEAENLAKMLVEERLVACVNILQNVTSVYRWGGQTESEQECVLVAKTANSNRKCVIDRVRELHSYDNPCIVAYDIVDGAPDYLDWVRGSTAVS